MIWIFGNYSIKAQRLKRVFHIDIETCPACGNTVRIIARIEDPVVIQKILDHRKRTAETNQPTPLPGSQAPPLVMPAGLSG